MIKKLSIKFHGTTTIIPSEMIVMSKIFFIAEVGDHLVIEKTSFLGEDAFVTRYKNGVVCPERFITLNVMRNLEYKECALEKYLKLKAFL